jgi:hypothetical protein
MKTKLNLKCANCNTLIKPIDDDPIRADLYKCKCKHLNRNNVIDLLVDQCNKAVELLEKMNTYSYSFSPIVKKSVQQFLDGMKEANDG